MKRRWMGWIAVCVCMGLVAAGCQEGSAPLGVAGTSYTSIDEVPANTTALVGQIRDALTDAPLPGVRVWSDPATIEVETNAAGEFVLSGAALRGGRFYRVRAEAQGYEPVSATVVARSGDVQRVDLLLAPVGQVGAIRAVGLDAVFGVERHALQHRITNASDAPSPVQLEVPADAGWLVVTSPVEALAPGEEATLELTLNPEVVYALWSSEEAPRALTAIVQLVDGAGLRSPLRVRALLGEAPEVEFSYEINDENSSIIDLNKPNRLSVAVDGTSIQRAAVDLTFARASGFQWTRRVWTDSAGGVDFDVILQGLAPMGESLSITGRLVSYGAEESISVALPFDEAEQPGQVVLSVLTATPTPLGQDVEVVAQVLGEDGARWGEGEPVVFRRTNPAGLLEEVTTGPTDAQGEARYAFTPTMAGRYTLEATLEEHSTVQQQLEVEVVAPPERVPTALLHSFSPELGPFIAGEPDGLEIRAQLVGADGMGVGGWTVTVDFDGQEMDFTTDLEGRIEPWLVGASEAGGYTVTFSSTGPEGQAGPGGTGTVDFSCPSGVFCPNRCTMGELAADGGGCVQLPSFQGDYLSGVIEIPYTVLAGDGLNVDIDIEVCDTSDGTLNTDACLPATQARRRGPTEGTEGLLSRSTARNGATHTFLWDSQVDVGHRNLDGVTLRARARRGDQATGWAVVSDVAVHNGASFGPPEVVSTLAEGLTDQRLVWMDPNEDGLLDVLVGKVKPNATDGVNTYLAVHRATADSVNLDLDIAVGLPVSDVLSTIDHLVGADILGAGNVDVAAVGRCAQNPQQPRRCGQWLYRSLGFANLVRATNAVDPSTPADFPVPPLELVDFKVDHWGMDPAIDMLFLGDDLADLASRRLFWLPGDVAAGPGHFPSAENLVELQLGQLTTSADPLLELLPVRRGEHRPRGVVLRSQGSLICINDLSISAESSNVWTSQRGVIAAAAPIDLDQDGLDELVVAVQGANGSEIIPLRWGATAPSFSAIPDSGIALPSDSGTPLRLVVGDVTQDGVPDVIVVTERGVWALRGGADASLTLDGDGPVALPFEAPLESGELQSATLRDADGDGQLDLLLGYKDRIDRLTSARPRPTALRWRLPRVTPASGERVELMDVDNDGRLDIIELTHSGGVAWHRGRGDGTLETPLRYSRSDTRTGFQMVALEVAETPGIYLFQLGDSTSPDTAEVLRVSWEPDGLVSATRQPFTGADVIAELSGAQLLGAWELTGDGRKEVVLASTSEVIVVRWTPDDAPQVMARYTFAGVVEARLLAPGEGVARLMVRTNNEVRVLEVGQGPTLTTLTTLLASDFIAPPIGRTLLFDLDGDGVEEVLVYDVSTGAPPRVLRQDASDGLVVDLSGFTLDMDLTPVAIAPATQGGEEAWVMARNSALYRATRGETGAWSVEEVSALRQPFTQLTSGDLDGDGTPDPVLLLNGQLLTIPSASGLGARWGTREPVAAMTGVDHPNTGRSLLTSEGSSGCLYPLDGGGGEPSCREQPAAAGASQLSSVDFDADGQEDLLITSTVAVGGNQIALLRGTTNDYLTPATTLRNDATGASAYLGADAWDVDQDGIPELLVTGSQSLQLYSRPSLESADVTNFTTPYSETSADGADVVALRPGRRSWLRGHEVIVLWSDGAWKVLGVTNPGDGTRPIAPLRSGNLADGERAMVTAQLLPWSPAPEIVLLDAGGTLRVVVEPQPGATAADAFVALSGDPRLIAADRLIAVDADGDGVEELIVVDVGARTLHVARWERGGDRRSGTWSLQESLLLPGDPTLEAVLATPADGLRRVFAAVGFGSTAPRRLLSLSPLPEPATGRLGEAR